jgi:hypothetical protein
MAEVVSEEDAATMHDTSPQGVEMDISVFSEDVQKKLKDLPDDHVAVVHLATGDLVDVRPADDIAEVAAGVLYEQGMFDITERGGSSHLVDYASLYDMLNSEPNINQSLALRSELPIAYGYTFQYPDMGFNVVESPVPLLDPMEWEEWAQFVNLDHVMRQAFHSLLTTGNLWIEKFHDKAGLNKGAWGIYKMRVLSPDAMYNVVDDTGNIVEFIQWVGDTPRTFGKSFKPIRKSKVDEFIAEKKKEDKDGTVHRIPRHRIAYWNYNAYYDDTVYGYGSAVSLISYARSKIGIQKRVLRMVENNSGSFIVFKYGTAEYMVAGGAAKKVMNRINKSKNPRYIVLPWYFDVEAVEQGKPLQNVQPLLDFFREEEMTGIGLPPVLTGRGGSSEGAVIQLEILVRQIMYLQRVVGNLLRKFIFPDALLGVPTASKKIFTDDEKPEFYGYMTRSVWHAIPMLRWNIIETVADRRLRHDVAAKHGFMGLREIRKESGYQGSIEGPDLPLIAKAKQEMQLAERSLDLEEEVARNPPEPASTASKSSPRAGEGSTGAGRGGGGEGLTNSEKS